ncbi:hypothetical protein [Streptomyces sp. NPDC004579]|uniref:hypothetical protein n=1 Tax=Streptomyces sp. NPDC004579 TaxID=3154667 RepID=UPI0033A1D284
MHPYELRLGQSPILRGSTQLDTLHLQVLPLLVHESHLLGDERLLLANLLTPTLDRLVGEPCDHTGEH